MEAEKVLEQRAYRNALGALWPSKRLPLNVFKNSWDDFFFFESDSIFQPGFISVMNDLMDAEDAHVCCLVNLGNTVEDEISTLRYKYLDRSTSPEHYMSLLRGNGAPDSWLYLVDRYVCTSDKRGWCIYCEKENDIAVVAVRNKIDTEKLIKAVEALQASSIKQAHQSHDEGKFRFEKLTRHWLSTLVTQYPVSATLD